MGVNLSLLKQIFGVDYRGRSLIQIRNRNMANFEKKKKYKCIWNDFKEVIYNKTFLSISIKSSAGPKKQLISFNNYKHFYPCKNAFKKHFNFLLKAGDRRNHYEQKHTNTCILFYFIFEKEKREKWWVPDKTWNFWHSYTFLLHQSWDKI